MPSCSSRIVIPAEAGIQFFQWVTYTENGSSSIYSLDSRFHGNDILDHLCFSISLNYFNQLHNQPCKNSGNSRFFLKCIKQGVFKAKKVFFIADGASWIRTLKDNYFPEAIGVLDICHLEREFKKALGEERAEFVGSLKVLALQGKGLEILQRLIEEGVRVKTVEERKKIIEVMTYVRNNLYWIANIPKVQGYGSGPVEKTADITVARRFKKRGMSWYRRNANPLLKLRLLKLNGEWDFYWKERRKEFARYAA
jgi:hypothetical protein